jgi:hypothetical protein
MPGIVDSFFFFPNSLGLYSLPTAILSVSPLATDIVMVAGCDTCDMGTVSGKLHFVRRFAGGPDPEYGSTAE